MSPIQTSLFTFFFLISLPGYPGLPASDPEPDPVTVQPFVTNPSPPATIPAFPEQSDVAGCRLDLPEQFYHGIKTACGGAGGELRRGRCCPVLASWLYAAYSATALGSRAGGKAPTPAAGTGPGRGANTTSYDLPMLPDDSETCVGEVERALRGRGIELAGPNETCDVVYCYCGIRLHPLSCPEAFSASPGGMVKGDKRVRRLERDCLSSSRDVNGFPGLGGCSKCLNTLHLLNNNKALNTSKTDDRTTKMHNKDCELMGLTWLLAKNRTAYMHTVSAVIRAIMMSTDGSDHPHSCALTSDGMPLAVDSSEISDQSSSTVLGALPISLCIALISFLYYMHFAAISF
ncbi:GPI-anchored protein [Trema orientale]|uniref:GPI-anchored protein n=1 Tax=Trema orientale TaxID=63057 RepID=A0A2P5CRK1_TREOI|nr:GPI-anchored protein [Trema orientale]